MQPEQITVERNAPAAPAEEPSRPTSDTPARGRRLNMIGGRILRRVIDRAVRVALRTHLPSLDERQVDTFCGTVLRKYRELVDRNARAIRGMSRRAYLVELERTHSAMLAEGDRLRDELGSIRQKLDHSQNMLVVEREHFAQRAVDLDEAFDQELGEELRRVLADSSLDGGTRQRRLVELATGAVHQARRSAFDDRVNEHQRRIQLYERRITKLKGSLEQTESELVRLAASHPGDPGLASVYRTVQGLSGEESLFEAKKELLEEIFAANVLLRREVAAQRESGLDP